MSETTVATLSKMVEQLPEFQQERVVDHVREYIADLCDEEHWDRQFNTSMPALIAAAKNARKEIADQKAAPMSDAVWESEERQASKAVAKASGKKVRVAAYARSKPAAKPTSKRNT